MIFENRFENWKMSFHVAHFYGLFNFTWEWKFSILNFDGEKKSLKSDVIHVTTYFIMWRWPKHMCICMKCWERLIYSFIETWKIQLLPKILSEVDQVLRKKNSSFQNYHSFSLVFSAICCTSWSIETFIFVPEIITFIHYNFNLRFLKSHVHYKYFWNRIWHRHLHDLQ